MTHQPADGVSPSGLSTDRPMFRLNCGQPRIFPDSGCPTEKTIMSRSYGEPLSSLPRKERHPGNRLLILLAGLNTGMIVGVVYSWSIFVLPLEEFHGWTRIETSLTYTFMVAFQCVGLLAGGVLIRRFGVRVTELLGAFMLFTGFLGSSLAEHLATLYVGYGIIAGTGLGILNIIPTAVCMRWYPEKQGLISGLCHMSIPLGTLLYGSTLAPLFIAATDINMTFRILGCVFFLIACVCAAILRMPPAGFMASCTTGPAPVRPGRDFSTAEALRSPACRYIWLWVLTVQIGGFMATGHIAPFAVERGLAPEYAGLAVGIFALGNGCGKFSLGFLSDKIGARPAMFVSLTLLTAGLLSMGVLAGGWLVLPCAMVTAMGFGGLFSLLSVVLMSFFGARNYGILFGICSTPMIVAAFAGPYLGSIVRSWTGDYRVSFLGAAALSLLGFLWITRIRPPENPS